MNNTAQSWIKRLQLRKHPEGGYFRETYRSKIVANIAGYDGPRHVATAIYYLLTGDQFSAFHRMKSDEMWHHYAGSSLTLYVIDGGRDGKLSKVRMGRSKRETLQAVLKAGSWFAASVNDPKSYCLLGCTVCPGFDYRDWELGKQEELVKMFPQHKTIIERYTIATTTKKP